MFALPERVLGFLAAKFPVYLCCSDLVIRDVGVFLHLSDLLCSEVGFCSLVCILSKSRGFSFILFHGFHSQDQCVPDAQMTVEGSVV